MAGLQYSADEYHLYLGIKDQNQEGENPVNKHYVVLGEGFKTYKTQEEAIAAAKRLVGNKNPLSYVGSKQYVATVDTVVEAPLPEAVVTTLAS